MCSLVVPCFNEASRWQADYWAKLLELDEVDWIFVDDGSADGTGELLSGISGYPNVTVINLPRNRGKAEAVRTGLLHALNVNQPSVAVGFIDADGAFPLDDVRHLLGVMRQRRGIEHSPDGVWSSRVALAGRSIQRTLLRHYIGRIVSTIVSIGEPDLPYDTQSGFKLFAPSPILRDCLSQPFRTRWFFELELVCRWRERAGRPISIWEEPLDAWNEMGGSNLRLRTVLAVVRELTAIKVLQARSRRRVTRRA